MKPQLWIACLSLAFAGAAQAQTGQPAQNAPQAARAAGKKPETIRGVISKFECGDNCYLTIKTARAEKTGLCEAAACIPWVENQTMPGSFVGKKARVTTGTGVQRDGSGQITGRTAAFKTLDFLE
ncbi:MAG: hypothetical protein ACK5JM_05815 [Rhodoblastus sp.]